MSFVLSCILSENTTKSQHIFYLSQEEINFIKMVLQFYPHKIHQMHEEIKLLVVNGTIQPHNIPQIVIIISNIYNDILLENPADNPILVIHIIKFTTNSILDAELIPLPNVEMSIINEIINTALTLLNMNLPPIKQEEKSYCASFFPHCFLSFFILENHISK